MRQPFTKDTLAEAHLVAQAATATIRLPLRNTVRHGFAGNILGSGLGSSVDFQDHRSYLPGDDPRYIDWSAYARSGQYIMKLYREEVTPKLELVLDCSSSMFFDNKKVRRTWELFYFAVESAQRVHASIRCYAVIGARYWELREADILSYAFSIPNDEVDSRDPILLSNIPFRSGSIRIVISDLLYPGAPATMLVTLRSKRSQGIIFSPYCRAESDPEWTGNMLFVDCEGQGIREQYVSEELLERYKEMYARHFSLWRDESICHQIRFAQSSAELGLLEAFKHEGLPGGAVELCH